MSLVDVVILAGYLAPVGLVFREEGVGLLGSVVNLGQTQAVGHAEGLGIDAGTTDDVYLLILGAMSQSLLERWVDIATREETPPVLPCMGGEC